jgi:hypothetical protein
MNIQRDPLLEMERQIRQIQKELDTLRTIERPVACRWRGSSAGAPANIREGDVYYDTGTGEVYIYANSVSRQIS